MEKRKSNYDKYPFTEIDGDITKGWNEILKKLKESHNGNPILAIDLYVGTHEEEIKENFKKLDPDLFINTRSLFKTEEEIRKLTAVFVTDDTLFGHTTALKLSDYFDRKALQAAQNRIRECKGLVVVVGTGANIVAPNGILVYADLARWEHQLRMKKGEVKGLGIDNREETFASQHKRCYFNDWIICDAHKDRLFNKVDFWLDTHIKNKPSLIDRQTFFKGIEKTVNKPFRVVPFFAPAPWGGQWMKEVCDLDRDEINYGWCFDCVPEENSLYFKIQDIIFEIPSVNVVLLKSKELLGAPVESRFGKDFPIRFDFLDTVGGGYLSFQVHPTTHYIRENFGMKYTQDESYYMLDAKKGATVYLGLKNNVDREQMSEELRKAQDGSLVFDPSKYANKLSVKKHDHFLIPAGTVHCSGPEGLVLEISSTPNHFTFKMWDWGRLGLDGKPRPINIDRGLAVVNWERDTEYTLKHLVNTIEVVATGNGWVEERTGLHPDEYIETRRHRFTQSVEHHTGNSVNVLNLVEGEEAIIESPDGSFEPLVVHYAETFIIPAHLKKYTIRPYGKAKGKECMTIKAFVRF